MREVIRYVDSSITGASSSFTLGLETAANKQTTVAH